MEKTLLAFILMSSFLKMNSQNALNFDGTNDYVQTNYIGITGTANRTFEAWIYLSSAPTRNNCIMDYGPQTAANRNTFIVNANRAIGYIAGGTNTNITSSSNVVPINQWVHVAFVKNGGTGYLYVNGTQVGTGNLSNVNTGTTGTRLRIGQRVPGGSIPFSGIIDEVRVWDVARTQTEIASTMNSEFCSAPSSLKAYYRFNHGVAGGTNTTVTSATDDAGTNNGTLNNFSLSGTSSNWVTGKNISPVTISSTIPVSACGSYTMPNGTVVTTAGTYYDTVGTSTSCDTLASYVITFAPAVIKNTVTDSGCITYTTSMGTVITASGTYYDTLPTSSACDTTIQYNITISGAVDDSVFRVGNRITSWDTWADHQWIRCDSSNLPIPGETNRFINVTTPGDYAVIVTRGTCVDTSDCVNFNPASLKENERANFSVFPNPANELLFIKSNFSLVATNATIVSINGKIIFETTLNSNSIDISRLPSGIFFLELNSNSVSRIVKFVKQ